MNHGTHADYYAHKRRGEKPCDDCLRAYRRHVKAWKLERDRTGPRIVPGDAVREHVRGLLDAGMSLRSIGKFSGVSPSTISNLLNRPGSGINRRSEAAILAVTAPRYDDRPDDETFVPRIGAERRVRALLALGWTHAHMRAECGVLTHVLLSQAGSWITQRNHTRIREMYDRLSMTPGPSERTRLRAARLGYLPPLAWADDEIDDPSAWADLGSEDVAPDDVDEVVVDRLLSGSDWRAIGATRAERIAAAEQMDNQAEVERRLGLLAHRDYTPKAHRRAS